MQAIQKTASQSLLLIAVLTLSTLFEMRKVIAQDPATALEKPLKQEPVKQEPAKQEQPPEQNEEVAMIEAQVALLANGEAIGVDVEVFGDVPIVLDGVELGGNGAGQQAAQLMYGPVAVDSALIRRVCKPSEDQLKQLNQFDAKWVAKEAKLVKGNGERNVMGGFLRVFAGGMPQQENPNSRATKISALHRKEVAKILTAEQNAAFEKAVKERDEFRIRANAECVVAMLDERLFLSAEQRKQLTEKLMAWRNIAHLEVHFYFQNQIYLPTLPSDIAKVLNASQRAVYGNIQQVDFQGDMFGVDDAVILIAN